MSQKKQRGKRKKAAKRTYKKQMSWQTTDSYEIELRRSRAIQEKMEIQPLGNADNLFGDYKIFKSGVEFPSEYIVEIRSLDKRINYCTCPDFAKNSLGTCKHIEKVLLQCNSKKNTNYDFFISPFIEVFRDFSTDKNVYVSFPSTINIKAQKFICKYLDITGEKLKQPLENTLQILIRDYKNAEQLIQKNIRISRAVYEFEEKIRNTEHNKKIKEKYANELRKSAGEAEFLRYPLYDYQIDGMLHLAFTGRGMLADEMGLGKTVQAIAAAYVLHKLYNISRVLIVCPASLKSEWEEQIYKFTNLPLTLLIGTRKERLKTYQNCKSFFLITNYEQIIRDFEDVNSLYQPDLIILDEAQRIKNWKTKTAQCIKRLQSRFAFVLTGTPLENKIDELYSLTEFIDPTIFGSLFRFNRMFFRFDEDGKIIGLKNLKQLHEMIKPIMLRRRKDEIEEQLPDRIDNNYFVDITKEQRLRYEEYLSYVGRLLSYTKYRPLTAEEFDKLQRYLACMRMLCDSVYILDQNYPESPKIDELMRILNDIWAGSPERKVIIFSEWVKMLELIRERLEHKGINYALHVGYVPQKERRIEINKFKNSPECKVFLSSDSGGLGLNLQAASVVINMDLPWNPAKLEQRIARAWRKHQKNSVNVINIVAHDTIEQKMLATLSYKKGLADCVLDGIGDTAAMEQEDVKRIFIERLSEIINVPNVINLSPKDSSYGSESISESEIQEVTPIEKLKQEIKLEAPNIAKMCSIIEDKQKPERAKSIFAVSNDKSAVVNYLKDIANKTKHQIKEEDIIVIDENAYLLLCKLAEKGIIHIDNEAMEEIFKHERLTPEQQSAREKKLKIARNLMEQAERKFQAGALLFSNGFQEESFEPFNQAVSTAAKVLRILAADDYSESSENNVSSITEEDILLIKNKLSLPPEKLFILESLLSDKIKTLDNIKTTTEKFIEETAALLNRFTMS